jgi:hypothetical protein
MLKVLRIAAATTLVAAFHSNSWGQSQEPPRQDSQSTQQQPNANQRGTEQSPFIIQIQPAPQTQEKPSTGGEKGPEKRSDTWLFGWLDGWNLSDKIAGIASVAAFLQFLALIATVWIMVRNGRRQLRAYVFPEDISLADGSMLDPP